MAAPPRSAPRPHLLEVTRGARCPPVSSTERVPDSCRGRRLWVTHSVLRGRYRLWWRRIAGPEIPKGLCGSLRLQELTEFLLRRGGAGPWRHRAARGREQEAALLDKIKQKNFSKNVPGPACAHPAAALCSPRGSKKLRGFILVL